MPVSMYIGGPEHACMHLIYARFVMMALKDFAYVTHDEPFKKLVHP
jgi:leucyl-tRNA synthetase